MEEVVAVVDDPSAAQTSMASAVQEGMAQGGPPVAVDRFFREAAAWPAGRAGFEVVRTPGSHTPQFDQPDELVRTIRPLLRVRT